MKKDVDPEDVIRDVIRELEWSIRTIETLLDVVSRYVVDGWPGYRIKHIRLRLDDTRELLWRFKWRSGRILAKAPPSSEKSAES